MKNNKIIRIISFLLILSIIIIMSLIGIITYSAQKYDLAKAEKEELKASSPVTHNASIYVKASQVVYIYEGKAYSFAFSWCQRKEKQVPEGATIIVFDPYHSNDLNWYGDITGTAKTVVFTMPNYDIAFSSDSYRKYESEEPTNTYMRFVWESTGHPTTTFSNDYTFYNVNLVTNGGSTSGIGNISYVAGTAMPLPTEVVKQGNVFAGWYTNSEFTGNAVTEIGATETGDKTFYAKWDAAKYEVVFKDGDNVLKTETIEYGNDATAPELTRAGYTLSWDKDFTNVTENMEINAVWTANNDIPYKIEYYLRNTDLEVEGYDLLEIETLDKVGTTDATVSITDADIKEITGFTYNSDNTNNVLSGTVTADGFLTLKLYYSRNIYNVTYELNSDTGTTLDDTYMYGKEYVLTRDVTREHYTFDGWYDNPELTGEEITKIVDGQTGDKTFYAKWKIEDFYIRSDIYEIDETNKVIYKVSPETTVEEFKSKIDTNGTMSVIGHVGNSEGLLPENGFVSTGDKLKVVYNGTTYTYHIAVRGDLNGDGKVSLLDLSLMNQVLVGKTTLTELKEIAADINYDGNKTLVDLSLINQAIVGKIVL